MAEGGEQGGEQALAVVAGRGDAGAVGQAQGDLVAAHAGAVGAAEEAAATRVDLDVRGDLDGAGRREDALAQGG